MKWYSVTAWDEAATVPINVTVCGDITITVSHARQAMGSLKICQIHFHISSLLPGRPFYSWPDTATPSGDIHFKGLKGHNSCVRS